MSAYALKSAITPSCDVIELVHVTVLPQKCFETCVYLVFKLCLNTSYKRWIIVKDFRCNFLIDHGLCKYQVIKFADERLALKQESRAAGTCLSKVASLCPCARSPGAVPKPRVSGSSCESIITVYSRIDQSAASVHHALYLAP